MTRKRWVLISGAILLLMLVSILAWLKPRQLPKDEAEQLFIGSAFFKKTQPAELTLYVNRIFPKEDLLREHREIQSFFDAGWVDVAPNVVTPFPLGAKFTLTAAGEKEAFSENWRRGTGSGGEDTWTVVLARKRLVETSEPVAATRGSAECSFTWTWTPVHPALSERVDTTQKTVRAVFHLDENDRWHIEEDSLSPLP